MKHSLGGKNGWCGTCVKKPGDPESNCPRDGDTVDTIARSGKNWGFCSDLCSKTDEAPIDILQETKLDVLSLKDCGILGPKQAFNRTREVCAGNKNDYPQMRVYKQKKNSGGKIYYNRLQSQTNYVNVIVCL
jgi:hypothetical protein